MVIQNVSYLKIPLYIQVIIDEIAEKNRTEIIIHNILLVFFFTLIMTLSLFYMRKLIIGVSRKIEYELRKKIYNKLLFLDYDFYQKNETGDIMSRLTNDLNDVRTLLGPGILYIPNAVTRLIIFLPALIVLSGTMMLIIGGILIILILMIVFLLPRLQPLYRKIQEHIASISSRVWQTITGITAIKQYNLETIENTRFEALNRDYIKANMSVVRFREFLWPFFIFSFSLTELIILLIGGQRVIQGQMTLGQLMQFTMLIVYLAFPVLSMGWVMSLLQQGISAMHRINYILDQPSIVRKSLRSLDGAEVNFLIKGLNYRYPGNVTDTLRDINLSIESGLTVGITGTIGCGKSTLLNILNGLLKPEPGTVFINGMDILEIDPQELIKKLAIVSQNPFLFSKTVAENIALGSAITDENAVRMAARNAKLEHEINDFPNGFDQVIGERGMTLSGGQRQRMAIARALYKCVPVLILDDPLSSVDAVTESKILANLKSMKCYQTMILVSHRISALKHTDIIFVMDKGSIVEQGTHSGLLRKKGFYSSLAALQRMEI